MQALGRPGALVPGGPLPRAGQLGSLLTSFLAMLAELGVPAPGDASASRQAHRETPLLLPAAGTEAALGMGAAWGAEAALGGRCWGRARGQCGARGRRRAPWVLGPFHAPTALSSQDTLGEPLMSHVKAQDGPAGSVPAPGAPPGVAAHPALSSPLARTAPASIFARRGASSAS